MPTEWSATLAILATLAYGIYFWKFRIPATPEKWRPPLLVEILVIWAVTFPFALFIHRHLDGGVPLLLCSLVFPAIMVGGSFLVWKLRFALKHRKHAGDTSE